MPKANEVRKYRGYTLFWSELDNHWDILEPPGRTRDLVGVAPHLTTAQKRVDKMISERSKGRSY